MTSLIVGLPTYGLLAIMAIPIYGWLIFGSVSFDYLLYAGFGLLPRNQKIADTMRKSASATDPQHARLAAFIVGLALAAISYGCWWLALLFLEVWLGQS